MSELALPTAHAGTDRRVQCGNIRRVGLRLRHAPDAREGDLLATRLGPQVLLSAIDVADRDARWRSIERIQQLSAHVRGVSWTLVDLQPDHDSWRIERSEGTRLEWDPESAPNGKEKPDPGDVARAKEMLRSLVPLELAELHHYVDWTHELAKAADGSPAPMLPGITRERIALGLPAPQPKRVSSIAKRKRAAWIVLGLCLVGSAFTVSAVQPPGPGAFQARFTHFAIEAVAFWLLFFGASRMSDGRESARTLLVGCVAILAGAATWGVLLF